MAVEVAHVGSTSVPGLCAKPIIDIAVAVHSFDAQIVTQMESAGFLHRPANDNEAQRFFIIGQGEWIESHIHVVKHMSMEWRNYLNYKAYLTAFPQARRAYAALKRDLAERYPNDRNAYTEAKAPFITYTLRKAMVWSYLGMQIDGEIDRPIGYVHTKGDKTLIYPINYGYIPGVLGGDGEEMDVYLLGVDTPVEEFDAHIIAIVHREDDVEDKLIGAPEGMTFIAEEIAEAVHFQEQYYRSYVESID